MTDADKANGNGNNGAVQPGSKRRWARPVLVGALLVGIATVSGFAIGARSATAWMWHGGWHHYDHGYFDAEDAAEHVEWRVKRVLSRVDATQEQQDKVGAIAKSAVSDIAALGFTPGELRSKFVELLRADTVDPAAFETLRAEQVAKVDMASKRAVQAMTEAAAVLTPEQRRELTDRWNRRFRR